MLNFSITFWELCTECWICREFCFCQGGSQEGRKKHFSAAGCPWVYFSFIFPVAHSRERGITRFFRDFFQVCNSSSCLGLFIPAEHPHADQGFPKICFILVLSPVEPEWDPCPHPPCSPLPGERPKGSHPAPGGNFPGGNKGIVRSHGCPFPCPAAGRLQIFQLAVKACFRKIWDFPTSLG